MKLIALESLKGCAIIRPHGSEEIAMIKKFSERLNHFEIPTVEVEPVKHAKWIPYDADCRGYAHQWCCTECKTYSYTHTYQKECEFEYCPNCGAKMDGGEPDENAK